MNILSGCDHIRFSSHVNHAVYARKLGYRYVFKSTINDDFRGYDYKLTLISQLPVDNQWWFWLDDDAFFTSFDPIESLNLNFDEVLLIFPKSPISPQGLWTYISSGNFFFRNTLTFKKFITQSLHTDLSVVRDWWKSAEHGFFTNGDQDKLVYNLLEKGWAKKTRFVPYQIFNTRPYHFRSDIKEYFLCHFAGGGNGTEGKLRSIKDFQRRFSYADLSLVPTSLDGLKEQVSIELNQQGKHDFHI